MTLYAKNAKELAALIGRRGALRIELLTVEVEVVDARFIYGRVQVDVKPIMGLGEQWVDLARVTMLDAGDGAGERRSA